MDPWKSAEPKPESNPSTVTIFGSEYRIRGPADSTYGRRVAELVDARMREVAEHQRIQSPIRVAILTLLNLTDELLAERQRAGRLATTVEEEARRLEAEIAAAVGAEPGNHSPDRGWSD
ncbi:MAG TPA: cell division protein ZapA [Candidatus Eisenbacteria bacterium]|jgi:cell division protein ZapA